LRAAFNSILAAGAVLLWAAPAYAAGGATLPEPSSISLLTLGLAGLFIGRRASTKRPKD
jgi:hypothetical protein